jgi:hypothetical protein
MIQNTWCVKYRDLEHSRDMESRILDSREEALGHATALEKQACKVYSIIGPSGETYWEEIKPKQKQV